MEERTLTDEELMKLDEFEDSEDFQKQYKLIKNEVFRRYKRGKMFFWKILLCIFVLVLFFPLGIALAQFLFVFIIVIPAVKNTKLEEKSKLNETYIFKILNPILQILFPAAEIVEEGDDPVNEIKYTVPESSHYNLGWSIKFNDKKDLKASNFYVWHTEARYKSESRSKVVDFRGVLYSLNLDDFYEGQVRVVPTTQSKYLKKELQGSYFKALEGEKKIDVEDVLHNENYNIYCTDEVSARRFLNPSVLAWFDKHVGKYPLALYLKGNRLYISIHFKYYMFSVPDEKEELDRWTVEKAALSLKELNQEIRDTVNIFYQLSM